MKYALLVLGSLLIVVGGYFLFTGSHVVASERGWSSVIAGTTALTGGIITLALAGVVKVLEDLKLLLADAALRRRARCCAGCARAGNARNGHRNVDRSQSRPRPRRRRPSTPAEAEVPVAAQERPAAAEFRIPWTESGRVSRQGSPSRPAPAEPAPAIAELRRRVADDLILDWPGINCHRSRQRKSRRRPLKSRLRKQPTSPGRRRFISIISTRITAKPARRTLQANMRRRICN